MLLLVLTTLLAAPPLEPNVILLTWDGVRYQDFFDRSPEGPFPQFWAQHAANATVLGDPQRGEVFEGANAANKSLPAYQELMVGSSVPCDSNLCGPVQAETLVDRLVREGLGKRLAVVGSWGTIAHAVSSHPLPFVDVGLHDGELRPPWGDARRDRDTWTRALAALDKRPRFLWIALNDSDEWAHRGSRENYVAQLKRYDLWLGELLAHLAAMKGYGESTTIVCTTDHGRGDGDGWTEHSTATPMAGRAFAFVLGPGAASVKVPPRANHRMLRPTIEALLGLERR